MVQREEDAVEEENKMNISRKDFQEKKYLIGGKEKYVSVNLFAGGVYVHLRHHWTNQEGKLIPTKKGIALTPEEFDQLKSYIGKIEEDIVSAWSSKTHPIKNAFSANENGEFSLSQREGDDQLNMSHEVKKEEEEKFVPPPLKRRRRMKKNENPKVAMDSLVVDEVAAEGEEREVLEMLKKSFAEHLLTEISLICNEMCYGCQTGHPSQTEHDICLMVPFKDQVETNLVKAVEKVNENEVFSSWLNKVNSVFPEKPPASLTKFNSSEWASKNLYSKEFLNDVKNIILRDYSSITLY